MREQMDPKDEAEQILAKERECARHALRWLPPDCPECKVGRLFVPSVRFDVGSFIQPHRMCSNCGKLFWSMLLPNPVTGKRYYTEDHLEVLESQERYLERVLARKKEGGSNGK